MDDYSLRVGEAPPYFLDVSATFGTYGRQSEDLGLAKSDRQ